MVVKVVVKVVVMVATAMLLKSDGSQDPRIGQSFNIFPS